MTEFFSFCVPGGEAKVNLETNVLVTYLRTNSLKTRML